jgi:hypothetical protein
MSWIERSWCVRRWKMPSSFEITAYAAQVESLDLLAEAGVDRAVFSLPPAGADVIIPNLDELAAAVGLT